MVAPEGLTFEASDWFVDKLLVIFIRFSVHDLWAMVIVLHIHDRIDTGVIAFNGVKVHTLEFEIFPVG